VVNPGEFGFSVATQVSELWWTLIVRELQAAQTQLRADDLTDATRTLRRVVAHFEPLNATWRSIASMRPKGLLAMRSQASGQLEADTPLQGGVYRHLVCLLGIRQAAHPQPSALQPRRRGHLDAALAEPGIYDDVLAHFSRIGLAVPEHLLERDPGTPYIPSQDIEQLWRDIYEDPYPDAPLQQLGDTLAEIAEAFTEWNFRHLMATRRTVVRRPSLAATGGGSWAPAMDALPFPELWSARGVVASPSPACPLSA
jgi:tryptophan 2,3-dioxygenase